MPNILVWTEAETLPRLHFESLSLCCALKDVVDKLLINVSFLVFQFILQSKLGLNMHSFHERSEQINATLFGKIYELVVTSKR